MKTQWVIAALVLIAVNSHAQDNTVEQVLETNAVEGAVIGEETTNTNIVEMQTTNATIDGTQETNITATDTNVIVEPIAETNSMVENIGYTLKKDDVFYASPFARFGIEGMDTQSGVKDIYVSLDGGVYSLYKGPVSFDAQGEHTINYKFIDHVGNVSYSKTFDVLIDATAPRVLEMNLNPQPYLASGYTYVGPNTEISFVAYDDITGVAYVELTTNDSTNWITYSSNITFASLGMTNTSLMTINYKATDMVSNVSPIKSKQIFVDAAAPMLDIYAQTVFEKDGIRYISSKSVISIKAFDSETKVDKVLYAINDGEYQEYNPEIGVKLTKPGNYDVKAKAIDIVGNESKEVIYSVVVDMLAPTGDVSYIGDKESGEYDAQIIVGSESQPISQTQAENFVIDQENQDTTAMPTTDMEMTETDNSQTTSEEVPAGTIAPVTQ